MFVINYRITLLSASQKMNLYISDLLLNIDCTEFTELSVNHFPEICTVFDVLLLFLSPNKDLLVLSGWNNGLNLLITSIYQVSLK